MRQLVKLLIAMIVWSAVPYAWADLEFNQAPKPVVLQDKLGGRLDGKPWSSAECSGKISVLFYADPDEKDLNNAASEALRAENFPLDQYQSFAIVNMAATWLPNFAISKSIEDKQKQYPNTLYVRDYKKVLVKEWGIADDTSDVLVFDKAGNLLFKKEGQLNEKEIKILVQVIRDRIDP